MASNDAVDRDPALDAAITDLAALMGAPKVGVFDAPSVQAAAGLKAWIAASPGLDDINLDDPAKFAALLQTVDKYAEDNAITQKTVGRGSKYSLTQAARAVGWLIRIDDDRGEGRPLEARRRDAAEGSEIEFRQLAAGTWQATHGLGDAYLLYLRRVLNDQESRGVILDRLGIDTHDDDAEGETSSRRRRRTVAILVLVAAVVAATALAIVLWPRDDNPDVPSSATLAERVRYDGKDPRGSDSTDSKCADPPPSQIVDGNQPAVAGPGGKVVGQIQLRTSPICPHVVWARVLWNGQESGLYTIPAGWTLHTILRRPDTGTESQTTDVSTGGEIQYGLSKMLTTIGGHCVLAEAYFTRGSERTSPAQTACVVVGSPA